MKASQLIRSLDNYRIYRPLKDFIVKGISCNSKQVKEGFIFIAVKGVNQDGSKFIAEAIKKGAKVIVTQNRRIRDSQNVYFIIVKDTRKALATLAALFYQNPSRQIKAIGITGTNGKTTITYLIESILKEAGFTPGVIGTINYRFKNKIIASKNTTPGPLELQALLREMVKNRVSHTVMEVSSHALDQGRVTGINFSSAIFTNLTRDHLDYHKTFRGYFNAKARLFKNLSQGAIAVINLDDSYAKRLKKLTQAKIITYGIKNKADVMAKNIKAGYYHTEFSLVSRYIKCDFKIPLIGRHNIYNCLAAISWALGEGLSLKDIKRAIEKKSLVPGRLERINSDKGFSVFVDYAHTDDALKNVITTLREVAPKKIIVVFGCGGDRDKTKRPRMGRVVSELADFAIITNDNPRSEDPMAIIRDIKGGIKKNNYCVMPDREKAIRRSLSLATKADIVLIAGKGHENYQIIGEKIIPFSDQEVVKRCLN